MVIRTAPTRPMMGLTPVVIEKNEKHDQENANGVLYGIVVRDGSHYRRTCKRCES